MSHLHSKFRQKPAFRLTAGAIRQHAEAGERYVPRTAIYGPAGPKRGGWIGHPMPYYSLLAGLCKAAKARRVLEIGTHYGGSTLSMLAGMRAGSPRARDLCLVTIDPHRLNEDGLAGQREIHRVDGALPSDSIWKAVKTALQGPALDLVFVDALKSHEFVGEVLLELTWRFSPRIVVLDDVRINSSMRMLWRAATQRLRGRCIDVSSSAPNIRSHDVGLGIIELEPDDLPLDIRPRCSAKRLHAFGRSALPINATTTAAKGTERRSSEDQLIELIGKSYLSGRGAALCCGGGSALALASGLTANPNRSRIAPRTIHALVPCGDSPKGGNPADAKARISAVLSLVGTHATALNVFAVRPSEFRWIGAPLEVVVLTELHSWKSASAVLRESLRYALPGECCLVTLGTTKREAVGLLLSCALLMDDVYPIVQIGAAVVFGVRAAPAPHRLGRLSGEPPHSEESIEWLDRFAHSLDWDDLAAHTHLAAADVALRAKRPETANKQWRLAESRGQKLDSAPFRSRAESLRTGLSRFAAGTV